MDHSATLPYKTEHVSIIIIDLLMVLINNV